MPPSSASRPSSPTHRPPSSASSLRPSSSASRPLSSLSHHRPAPASRPPTSLSSRRPLSALSSRTALSRLAQRAKQSKLLPSCQALVTQLTGITAEWDGGGEGVHKTKVDWVVKHVDPSSATNRAAASVDIKCVERSVSGHIQKARINLRDEWADALEKSYARLKSRVEKNVDLDDTMRMDRLPDHLHLLLLLSTPPSTETLAYASHLLDPAANAPQGLTWAQILAEEPFEGDHWKGVYGLGESGSDSWDSDPSPLEDDDDDDERGSVSSGAGEGEGEGDTPGLAIPLRYDHRDKIEALLARQYWRAEWRADVDLARAFDIGDASTLGPAVQRVLGADRLGPSTERYIYEHDAVREVLMALQGRQNLVLAWTHQGGNTWGFVPTPATPRLAHLTLAAQLSLLASFARTAGTLEHLRKYVSSVRGLRTLEAFAEALGKEVARFEGWCARREEEIVRGGVGEGESGGRGGGMVVSLLSLEKALRDEFGRTWEVLLGVARRVMRRATSRTAGSIPISSPALREEEGGEDEVWILSELPLKQPPAVVAAFLLDALFDAARGYAGMGDAVVPAAVLRVFAGSAEPVWGMVGRWVESGGGSGGGLEEEFFVEDNQVDLGDPDFWAEGYTVRGGGGCVPVFLERVRDAVVSAGKSVGLLRALGLDVDESPGTRPRRRFSQLLGGGGAESGATSVDELAHAVYDELAGACRVAQTSLTRVLFGECAMMRHLGAVEGLYLMMQGDDVVRFVGVLFAKMDTGQQWTDFHFLNTSFSDIVHARPVKARWVDSALVRLSYRRTSSSSARSVRALEGLLVEYAVPFPLTYVFAPGVVRAYNSLFVFLLQLRRAKGVLDSILVRGAGAVVGDGKKDEVKVFYAMRSKLSWFVNTLLNFVATYVLHTQVVLLHKAVLKAESLDDIIRLHEDHLEKICGRCLLRKNTAALHRAVLSVLDMSLYFNDCFVAFAGDTTHDVSRASLVMTRRHRSRQQRRLRRNVIGFSLPETLEDDSSESDDDEQGDGAPEPSFSVAASVSLAEEGFFARLDKMSSDLDGLVRFIRRGVESLAAGAGDSGQVFGVLAFSLEDWDR